MNCNPSLKLRSTLNKLRLNSIRNRSIDRKFHNRIRILCYSRNVLVKIGVQNSKPTTVRIPNWVRNSWKACLTLELRFLFTNNSRFNSICKKIWERKSKEDSTIFNIFIVFLFFPLCSFLFLFLFVFFFLFFFSYYYYDCWISLNLILYENIFLESIFSSMKNKKQTNFRGNYWFQLIILSFLFNRK